VLVHQVGDGTIAEKLADAAGKVLDTTSELTDKVMSAAHTERSRVSDYIGMLSDSNEQFAAACLSVSSNHLEETEIQAGMQKLSQFSNEVAELLKPFGEKYGQHEAKETEKLRSTLFPAVRAGAFGILRDLHALFVMASEIHVALSIVMQASKELRDEELLSSYVHMDEQNKRQQAWLMTQIEHRASHTLVVPQ
jgi:hypothetical protein